MTYTRHRDTQGLSESLKGKLIKYFAQATLSVLDNMDSGVGGRKQTEEEVAKKFGFEDYFIEGKGRLLCA